MNTNKYYYDVEKPVLLIGGSGMLGRAWIDLLRSKQISFEAPSSRTLDITEPMDVATRINQSYGAVVNCAGWTDVDGAEKFHIDAFELNAAATGLLANRCAELGIPFVHYSSDYVFDGSSKISYRVGDLCLPVNAYGFTKLAGEAAVRRAGGSALIIRTGWLFAPWGKNFVRTIFEKLHAGTDLRVVDDQFGRPTSVTYLARASLRLLTSACFGTWHVANEGQCSWYNLAISIKEKIGSPGIIRPCKSEDYITPARRPGYSVLDLVPTRTVLGPAPHWRDELESVLGDFSALEADRQLELVV